MKGKTYSEEVLVKKVKGMQKQELRAKNLISENKVWRVNWINLS